MPYMYNLLLEEDGTEARVESTETLRLVDLAETTDKTGSKGRLRHETDTGGLEGAESNVGEELGACRRGEVDGGTVVDGVLVTDERDGLLLEEFVTTELEGALEEVTSKGWAGTGQKSTGALLGNDLTEATDETAVVRDGVKLDPGLDTVCCGQRQRSITACFDDSNKPKTHTSTGVRPPWVTEQQTAPARANLE